MSAVTSSPSSKERSTSPASVPSLFAQRASETPHAVAIRTESVTWSYNDLDRLSNQIAAKLLRLGAGRGYLVGVMLRRGPQAVAAMLGILKAGAAYVPLDVTHPVEWLRFILTDTALEFVIASVEPSRNLGSLLKDVPNIIHVEEASEENAFAPDVIVEASDLAYVMYTSGSTGNPKGVMIEHRGIVRLVSNPNYVSISAADRFLQLAPLSFDAATFEIWAPLLNGARLSIMPPEAPSLSEIAEAVERQQITVLWLTSGLFNAMVDEFPNAFRNVKQLIAGGDVLSPPHVRKAMEVMQDGCFINGYGPTESTTFACCHRVRVEDTAASSIPIGLPVSGTDVYILNRDLQPVSDGECGEIYIGGDGLARGYLNRAELTAEKFIRHPFCDDTSARLYRSGDIGRYTARQEIEFLGRVDSQVKIRGFRIETSEIEIAAHLCPGISDCAVVATDGDSSGKSLCCFFVPSSGQVPSNADPAAYLKEKLPSYMIPAQFVAIERLPLNANGKVDRARLTKLASAAIPLAVSAEFDGDSLEAKLLAMLTGLLHVSNIQLDDDFFQLGGHSLVAARLFAQIEARFGKKLPLATIIQARTARQLAAIIRDNNWAAPWSSLVPLKPSGSRYPFFLVHAIGGNVLNYGGLADCMPADQPIYALQAQGLDGQSRAASSVEEMAAHYVRAIGTIQPEGPYYLGGFSAGGLVAFEMARQLQQAGHSVALLSIFDSSIEPTFRALVRDRRFAAAISRLLRISRFNLHYMGRIGMWEFLSKKCRNLAMNARILMFDVRAEKSGGTLLTNSPALPVEEAFLRARSNYNPELYNGGAILFTTKDSDFYSPDRTLGWGKVIEGNLEVRRLPGNHDNLLDHPQLEVLVQELANAINQACPEAKGVASGDMAPQLKSAATRP
jgi:amino acid adenylation domain-containing protein